ncbi:hypothetical protein [Longimicrobium sp.]|uniref:hypothetical protein n=1 Tax=Longimicrobium sp. TaxID=2029185 RepID=UPI003B3BBF4F
MSDAFAGLDHEQRRRAEALAERFRAAGAEAPEGWAASEVEDDIPQLARFIFLRRLWRGAWQWKQPPEDWFAEIPADDVLVSDEDDEDEPTLVQTSGDEVMDEDGDPPFLAAQQAVQRILAAGADPEDLKEVARAIFLHTAFDAVQTVDEGHDPEAGDGMPGWLLTEVGGDLVLTGRVIPDLHEDLLTTEPDGV